MVDFESQKNNFVKRLLEEFHKNYLFSIDEAKNVNVTFQSIYKQTNSEYIKAQSDYVKSKDGKLILPINNLIRDIENLLALKKKETYKTAFVLFTKGFKASELSEINLKVAICEAYKKQIDFLIDEEIKLFTVDNLKNENVKKSQAISIDYFPSIFKNLASFEMFLELKSLTVKEKTKIADYSFIFHQMKDKSIKAINSYVTQPVFIEFLNLNFKANILERKLPYRNPETKKILYTSILNKFKSQINGEPEKVQ